VTEPSTPPPGAPSLGAFGLPLARGQGALPRPSPGADASDGAPVGAAGPRLVLDDLLLHVMGIGGSDLHLTAGAPPTVRKSGEMQAVEGYPELQPTQLRETLYGILSERQR
jgi:twitching motility protein PilT